MKEVYDSRFRDLFLQAGIPSSPSGDLQHYLSDVATMQLIRWTEGGFGMCALNYDGDILTDELAQIHRSPGFLSSVLNGVREDGTIIKEFEASHGTVTDMWDDHVQGKETSLNPLSLIEALMGAMNHSAALYDADDVEDFTKRLQKAVHTQMVEHGTRDLDDNGLTTEEFVDAVAQRIDKTQREAILLKKPKRDARLYDEASMKKLFQSVDIDENGTINYEEFADAMKKLGVAPKQAGDRELIQKKKPF